MTEQFYVAPGGTFIRAGGGKFDSRKRYLVKDDTGFGVAGGKTVEIEKKSWVDPLGHTQFGIGWRNSVNGYAVTRTSSFPWAGTFPAVSFDATVELVSTDQGTGPPGFRNNTTGRMTVADEDGTIAFDSDREMFFAPDRVTGTHSVPTRTNIDTTVEIDTTHTLATGLDPSATAVFGWFRITGTTQAPFPAGLWAPIGGTFVGIMGWGNGISGAFRFSGTAGSVLTHMTGYTFRASGGSLFLDEQVYQMRINSADSTAFTLNQIDGFDIDYVALVGAFDA